MNYRLGGSGQMTSDWQPSKKKNIIFSSVLFLISIFLVWLFSYSTSPLYPGLYHGDSALFMLVGKSILQGKSLYIDLFDHKGPVMFFLQALGMLGGRNGVFALECFFIGATSIVMYQTACLLTKKSFLSVILTLVFLTFDMAGGNITEEYSILFIMITLYCGTKYILSDKDNHPVSYAVIYGICFTALALIRLTNAAAIGGTVLTIVIILIKKKQVKQIGKNAIGFIIGCLIVFVPISIYFLVHGSFYQMIYATFIYNIKYATHMNGKSLRDYARLLLLVPPILLSVLPAYLLKKKNMSLFMTIIAIVTCIATLSGPAFTYYFLLSFPVILIGIAMGLSLKDKKRIALIILLISLCIPYGSLALRSLSTRYDLLAHPAYQQENRNVQQAFSVMKEDSRIFGYNVPSQFFMVGDILPCYKYFTYQDRWGQSDTEVTQDIHTMLNDNPPDYIIINTQQLPDDDTVNQIVALNYHKISAVDVEIESEDASLIVYEAN